MGCAINLSSMKQVHPENFPKLAAATANSSSAAQPLKLKIEELTDIDICVLFFLACFLLFAGIFLSGIFYFVFKAITTSPFATFEVESLSLVTSVNTSEKQWNITLRVGNPRPEKDHGFNFSCKAAHASLSFYRQTIAIGHISPIQVLIEKEAIVNGALNPLFLYPEDDFFLPLDLLKLDIVVSVAKVDPSKEAEAIHDTLRVSCDNFLNVKSSIMSSYQFQTRSCHYEFVK